MARGNLLALWADDDYHAPWRLTYQVSMIQSGPHGICGCDSMLCWDTAQNEMWLYQFVPGRRTLGYVCGGTMMFRRQFWCERPFDDGGNGEDTRFIQGRSPVLGNLDYSFFVATQHGENTAPKARSMRLASEQWTRPDATIETYAAPWWIEAVQRITA